MREDYTSDNIINYLLYQFSLVPGRNGGELFFLDVSVNRSPISFVGFCKNDGVPVFCFNVSVSGIFFDKRRNYSCPFSYVVRKCFSPIGYFPLCCYNISLYKDYLFKIRRVLGGEL